MKHIVTGCKDCQYSTRVHEYVCLCAQFVCGMAQQQLLWCRRHGNHLTADLASRDVPLAGCATSAGLPVREVAASAFPVL